MGGASAVAAALLRPQVQSILSPTKDSVDCVLNTQNSQGLTIGCLHTNTHTAGLSSSLPAHALTQQMHMCNCSPARLSILMEASQFYKLHLSTGGCSPCADCSNCHGKLWCGALGSLRAWRGWNGTTHQFQHSSAASPIIKV